MPLSWSEPTPPTEGVSHYDHVITQTPLGPIMIEWKSWKHYPGYTCQMPWDEFINENELHDAKSAVQQAWNKMAASMVALAT